MFDHLAIWSCLSERDQKEIACSLQQNSELSDADLEQITAGKDRSNNTAVNVGRGRASISKRRR